MVSSALVDAVKHEKEQDWLGAVLTPNAIKIIEKANTYEITHKGKTKIDFLSEDFNSCVRKGVIPWKSESDYAKKGDSFEMYYIKPHMDGIEDKENWALKFLPPYFDDRAKSKINNSHRLYGE